MSVTCLLLLTSSLSTAGARWSSKPFVLLWRGCCLIEAFMVLPPEENSSSCWKLGFSDVKEVVTDQPHWGLDQNKSHRYRLLEKRGWISRLFCAKAINECSGQKYPLNDSEEHSALTISQMRIFRNWLNMPKTKRMCHLFQNTDAPSIKLLFFFVADHSILYVFCNGHLAWCTILWGRNDDNLKWDLQ